MSHRLTHRARLFALFALLSLLALLSLVAGCGGRPFVAATPPGFVDLGDIYGDDEYRAATADGVVLGVRAFENEPKGETSFWAKAIENRMREVGGYALLEKRSVKNRGGLTGTQLRFGRDEAKAPHLYIITIFTTDERVYLLEAGGVKDEMKRLEEQIDWSVSNFLQK
jgi:hypothetical protein